MNTAKFSKDAHVISERSPARGFEEAFPIGNGQCGAMIFGGVERERIALNHDKLWSGYPMETLKEGPYDSLMRAKKLVREKKYADADAELSKNFACYASQSYMPFGNLFIEDLSGVQRVRGYRRLLDLKNGVYGASYVKGDSKIEIKSFASHPDQVIVYRIDEVGFENDPPRLLYVNVGMDSLLYSKTFVDGNSLYLEVECPVTSEQNAGRCERKTVYSDDPSMRGIRAIARVDIITDGKKYNRLNSVHVKYASFIEIRICMATSFNGYDRHPFTDGADYKAICQRLSENMLSKSFEDLKNAHKKDHRRYYGRVCVDLGSDQRSAVATSKRLESYSKGASDKALPALLFNFGRYLIIASSRKDTEATNLQGIWSDKFLAPWHANYTININTEMNYFATLSVGLAEMYEPMIRLITEVAKNGERTAEVLYHAPGWCAHHNTDLWRHTAPVIGNAQYLFWNAAGGWLVHHLWEYYEFTLDEKFLKNTFLPVAEGSAKFYLSQLEDVDGYRAVFPSTSPENLFLTSEGKSAVAETTEMTMAIVRELFGNLVKAADILGYNSDTVDSVKEEIPKLLSTMIGSDGRIIEWYGEREENEPNHRHTSHLYSLHPGCAIDPEKTPELAKACRETLKVRTDDGTGWSLAWKCNFYARLWDGDHAFKLLKRQLLPILSKDFNYHHGGTYPNLFCAHPPFQIDGNFGAMSGISEMLLQSSIDSIHIIPALPSEWSDVCVKGLAARGKRTVDFKIEDGRLVYCKIHGKAPLRIMIAGKDMTCQFKTVGNVSEFVR